MRIFQFTHRELLRRPWRREDFLDRGRRQPVGRPAEEDDHFEDSCQAGNRFPPTRRPQSSDSAHEGLHHSVIGRLVWHFWSLVVSGVLFSQQSHNNLLVIGKEIAATHMPSLCYSLPFYLTMLLFFGSPSITTCRWRGQVHPWKHYAMSLRHGYFCHYMLIEG